MNTSRDSIPFADRPETPDPEEHLLREHLARALDGQLGQARRRFETALAQEAERPPLRLHAAPAGWNWRWVLGTLTAAAACLAFGISFFNGLDFGSTPRTIVSNGAETGTQGVQPIGYTPLEYRESWQAHDLGTYEFEGRPVRAVHRQQWERARYRNDQGYEVTIEVPREQLVLVDAPVQ